MSELLKSVRTAVHNKKVLALAFTAAVAVPAMAADPTPPDPSTILTYIAGAGVAMVAIANAKLLMELGIKAFAWIRQALRGG